MPTEVLMPALSPDHGEGQSRQVAQERGRHGQVRRLIAEIETDKATMEVEAVDEGTLGKILVPDGTEDVAVNTPIAMILAEGEDAAALKGNGGAPQHRRRSRPNSRSANKAAAPAAPAPAKTGAQAAASRHRRAPEPECRQAPRWSP